MDINKAKFYIIPAVLCLLGIIGAGYYSFLSDFSSSDEVGYVYIDQDDNIDSVCVKLEPHATRHGMTGFSVLARHMKYAENPREGRYAIEPDMSTLSVLRRLKNGQQAPLHLVVPESRTMEKLAAQLSSKLMLDSAEIADALHDSAFCARQGYELGFRTIVLQSGEDLFYTDREMA